MSTAAHVFILLLTLGLSGFAWFYAAVLSKTTTPSLLKLTQSQAAEKAGREGLDTKLGKPEYSETIPAGLVLDTDPKPGASIDKDGTVSLILSRGPERYAVLDVLGEQEEQARQMLDEHFTIAEPTRRYSDKVERGSVITVDPEVGTRVKPDTAVKLVISNGIKPVAVPDVVEMPVDAARAEIADAKLRSEVVERFDETVPAGIVISQDPKGGLADKNSVVELVVSKGPPLVEVPGVVGKPVAEAQAILTEAGFQSSVSQLPGGPGMVLRQDPGGGDKAPKGGVITLYVF